MVSKQSIERFFKDGCTVEERAEVAAYLDAHPEVLELYLGESEWATFGTTDKISRNTTEKIFQKVTTATYKKNLVVKRIGLAVAAACLLFIIGTEWNLFYNNKGEQIAATAPIKNGVQKGNKNLSRQENNTKETMQLVMGDGSVVELLPNSSIEYPEPFVRDNKRCIYLTGEALFKVAKDKSKPFTVFSGAIATTALGTSFTIRSFEKDSYIKVHLHTGKVVVKSADITTKKLADDMFMVPGNILTYHKDNRLATITNEKKNLVVKLNNKNGQRATLPNWYMFNNQSLSQVFDQLEEMYGVPIIYTNADIKSMYFIGKFDKTDSLTTILTTIAELNKLTVKKKGGSYIITP